MHQGRTIKVSLWFLGRPLLLSEVETTREYPQVLRSRTEAGNQLGI